MFGFEYYSPTKVIFGKGTENQAGELVKAYGAKKVLIHYGGKSAVKSGLIDRVKASLDAAGVAHVELGGVVPNPHLSKLHLVRKRALILFLQLAVVPQLILQKQFPTDSQSRKRMYGNCLKRNALHRNSYPSHLS